MRRMYWKPCKTSRAATIGLALLSLAAVALVHLTRTDVPLPHYQAKVDAATRARLMMAALKEERLRLGHPIEQELDPAQSGMIGTATSPVTSVEGNLLAKQTSVNPNFAAVIVDMLVQTGAQPGDCVAVGCSGSFPALNVCVLAALESLQLRPLIISSASASQYGANFPDFLWIDMERHLFEQGFISQRSLACSPGGYEDRGLGMTHDERRLITEAIHRNGLPLIESASFTEAIEQRMALYRQAAAGRAIRAYVNVGGGTVSVGRSVGKKLYRPGLNLVAPPDATQVDSVMTRFMLQETPVIHLVEILELAHRYGLPTAPRQMPAVGESHVYAQQYNRVLAGGLLLLLLALLPLATHRLVWRRPGAAPSARRVAPSHNGAPPPPADEVEVFV
jgi:poly-gamma-glutamate system protein